MKCNVMMQLPTLLQQLSLIIISNMYYNITVSRRKKMFSLLILLMGPKDNNEILLYCHKVDLW